MSSQEIINTAKALVADDKGLLAMDESNSTCNKRFAKLGIPQTEEARRAAFAHAIQQAAMKIGSGQDANVKAAQQALLHRARCNRAARRGQHSAAMEVTGA